MARRRECKFKSIRPLSTIDLDHVLEHTAELWLDLRGERLLLTGGTGFFGRWLTETFLHANSVLHLGASLTILSRDPQAFAASAPLLCANPALSLIQGDIRSFAFPQGSFASIIHAATDSVVSPTVPAETQYSTIVDGMRRVLEFAQVAGTHRLLFTSSGAVYGPQALSVSHIEEDHPFAPSDSPYALGKRDAEALCAQAPLDLTLTIARGFAFLGPHLPLGAHFAAGNFLANALSYHDIRIKGDGTPRRSYLYAADLAIWLWTILLRGKAGRAYNVGSEASITIQSLAETIVSTVNPGLRVRRAQQPHPSPHGAMRYVPSTQRARSELGLDSWINLEEAIGRTAAWHRGQSPKVVSRPAFSKI